ncbi:hypothetical protein FBU30_005778 [Linnemannia zychae]|nr:hypothetical protein FBU30_005778 [Linnemannia zychae]
MTQLDKAKSRLRLAQVLFEETMNLERAEEEVTKAIIIVDSIQGPSALDIQLRLYDLQTQIYIESKRFRLAKNTLRIASAEAAKQELHSWTYQFCFLKARVCFMMDDIAGSLTTLNQGSALADQQGDFDIKMAFWIVSGQYSLMFSKWDQAVFYLQKMAPHMGSLELLDFNTLPTTAPIGLPLAPETSSSSTIPTIPQELDHQQCQSQQLRVFFLILYIFCMIRSGRIEKTLFALTALHKALDGTQPKDTDEFQGVFRVFLKNKSEDPLLSHRRQLSQQSDITIMPSVCIRWMTFPQVYCLTYLLSGICSKADMTQPMKSQQFLVEGIKMVEREFTVNDRDHIQDADGYEAKTLALINIGLIFCGERYQNHKRSANVRCALHILDGATIEGLIPSRQHLHESLKLSGSLMNTQLKSLSLLLLGSFYKEAHDSHAEKMLTAGFAHAVKTRNQIVAVAAGFTLKDLYLQTSRGIKASEQAQKNKAFLDEVDRVFQSRILDPLLSNNGQTTHTTA